MREYIRAHQIFVPGPVLVAVSGGADSTALLLILAELAEELGIVLHVAHFDHRTRPKQSAEDADFVAKLANRIGAPIRVGRAEQPTTTEDAARTARYEFLRRAATEIGATAIATGHTRDDQAETVLLHLTRGSGLAGLAGMRPLREGIARPLLTIGRVDTVTICRAARIHPRSDPTNRSLKFARNRVRLEVLPELAKINPRASEAIARFAEAAAELQTEDDLDVAGVLARARDKDAVVVAALEPTVRSRALALAWRDATGRVLGARHRKALDGLAMTEDGSRSLDLPGGLAIREYGLLRIVGDRVVEKSDPPIPIEVGPEIIWNGWRIALGGKAIGNGAHDAAIPKKLLRNLVVRQRQSGDRMTGRERKKLQDLFTDAKIPASQRSRWPVIASEDGVWWVPGLTDPPKETGGTRLAVAAPAHFGNELWTTRVRQVASKAESVGTRPRKGPSN
ncbi:MAG TPA: tRNA lysidine(34) synthetase TilS [Candidatus Limnocylindria bacterium]|nr:tRNA lysidine(34) synthetase TilS [Candidatus Limnocylindria bacterium]